jgi:hypothetical protein
VESVQDTIEIVAGMIVESLTELENFNTAVIMTALLHVVAFLVVSCCNDPDEWLVLLGRMVDHMGEENE